MTLQRLAECLEISLSKIVEFFLRIKSESFRYIMTFDKELLLTISSLNSILCLAIFDKQLIADFLMLTSL